MREIQASRIAETVSRLCIEANTHLPGDMKRRIQDCRECETWPVAREILDQIVENYEIADAQNVPICQDTGMACVFLEIGPGGPRQRQPREAVDEGVRRGLYRRAICASPWCATPWTG